MAKKKTTQSRSEHDENSNGINFEDALADVQRIVGQLESGDAGLGESLELYEAGVNRLKQCHKLLGAAERKISLLSGFDADGNPIKEPFGDDVVEETLEEKQRARHRRRRSPAPQNDNNGANSGSDVADDNSPTVDDSPGLF